MSGAKSPAGWAAWAVLPAAAGLLVVMTLLGLIATGSSRAATSGALGSGCEVRLSRGGTVLPAAASPGISVGSSPVGSSVAGVSVVRLDGEQVSNARVIAGVARGLGLPVRAAAVGLMTAMQESSLRSLDHGDAVGPDSRGLFQQRPVFYPGVDRLDPVQASTAFYGRLRRVPGWERLPMWQAAQAVQRSADGGLYARWAPFGTQVAHELYGSPVAGGGLRCEAVSGLAASGLDGTGSSGRVQAVLSAAAAQLGRPYVWGGGDARGPTGGLSGARLAGFDCSGLLVYAFARVGVDLPHSSRAMYDRGRRVPVGQARPGDLVFLSEDGGPDGIHHVAVVWQPGQIIEAQTFGVAVHVRSYRGAREPEIMPAAVRVIA
jgi:peptidoglycan DL-endopeptidase CwlO